MAEEESQGDSAEKLDIPIANVAGERHREARSQGLVLRTRK